MTLCQLIMVIVCLLMQVVTSFEEKIPQQLPSFCKLTWQNCAHDQLLKALSLTCCHSNDPSVTLDFHCQEVKVEGKVIRLELACLPSISCPAGTIPVVHKDDDANVSVAFVQCQQCAAGYFEPHTNISSRHRYQSCQHRLQTCNENYGMALVRGGNSSHDTLCRCMTEKEFLPFPTSPACKSQEGFNGSSACRCLPSQRRHAYYEPGVLDPTGSHKASNDSVEYMGYLAVALMAVCLLLYAGKMFFNSRRSKKEPRVIEIVVPGPAQTNGEDQRQTDGEDPDPAQANGENRAQTDGEDLDPAQTNGDPEQEQLVSSKDTTANGHVSHT